MILKIKIRNLIILILIIALAISSILIYQNNKIYSVSTTEKKFIKYVEFNVPYSLLDCALKYDIKFHNTEKPINWIELIAYLGAKYGGEYKRYKRSHLDKLVKKLTDGESMEKLTEGMKYYDYYLEAYTAVLDGFVGEYEIEQQKKDTEEETEWVKKYGLIAFSPIAKGYEYWHYDDFGVSRTYGYKRVHLGNDLMGQVGTPIIAVEGGIIEALGWNRYGGWRIGIRSFDNKRYYYYAHLRKNFPFKKALKVGDTVKAGDVIGYMGRTGYSNTENTNNITKSHLHFGIELIFDESQKESNNEIWINVYNIVRLLNRNKSKTVKNLETKEYHRVYDIKY
ncbi:M23 family metallopeptidase [Sedimentibacter sp. zth1]|uniref:M23 family metallopeptidase n=1 Tax=Sedimentibacter sp. zth1 TaxID=2816908 RepID=UPI001A9164A9|nr:M23 family metallopeptidase [Sedimentibacter sp. zth1]QSX05379.1 M23 family metallopeptidase [Sedimentibacter sp. zth1]